MRKAALCAILVTLGIFLAGALPAAAAYRYTAKDLGTLPAPYNCGSWATAINTLIEARGINDRGQTIATGTDGSSRRAILLTPIPSLDALQLLLE
jgi:hypothetical protein